MEAPVKQTTAACLAIVLIGSITSDSAWARGWGGGHYGGGHWGGGWGYGRGYYGGIYIGPGFGWGWPYYSPPFYAYPPAVITAPSSPPVYIEQGGGQTDPQGQSNYWYYCADSQAYYPYVKQCPGGWQQVAPQPPAPR